jgi:hypothetical protein
MIMSGQVDSVWSKHSPPTTILKDLVESNGGNPAMLPDSGADEAAALCA